MSEKPVDQSVSLAPLTPEEALRALLAVDPDDEPAEAESRDGQAEDDGSTTEGETRAD